MIGSAALTVAGAGVVSYRYSLNDGTYSEDVAAVATPITLADLSDGSHTVQVLGSDAAGNEQPEVSATVVTWTVGIPVPASAGGGGGGCFLSFLGD